MIEIRIGGKSLELYPDTRLRLEDTNGFMVFRHIATAFSYPFEISRTATNDAILGYIGRPDNHNFKDTYEADIYLGTAHHKKGVLQVKSTTNFRIRVLFSNKNIEFEDVDIRSKDYGGQRVPSILGSYSTPFYYPDKDYFLGLVRNSNIWAGRPSGNSWVVLDTDPGGIAGQIHYYRNPQPYLIEVIDKVLSELGYKGDFFDNEEIRKLVFINPVWARIIIYSPPNPAPTVYTDFNLVNHIPDMSIVELLQALQSLFCLNIAYDNKGELEINSVENFLKEAVEIDITEKIIHSYETINTDKKGYSLKHDRPDEDSYKIILDFERGIYVGEFQEEADLLLLADSGDQDYAFVRHDGNYYSYDLATLSWKIVSYAYHDSLLTKGEVIEGKGSTVVMETSTYPYTSYMPQYMTGGNLSSFSYLTLAFARGTANDQLGDPRNLVSSDPWDFDNNTNGLYSLRIEGEKGLKSKWWNRYLKIDNREVLKVDANLNLADIASIKKNTILRIGNQRYIWQKMTHNVSMKSTDLSSIELMKYNG